jgi:hypothetical protein
MASSGRWVGRFQYALSTTLARCASFGRSPSPALRAGADAILSRSRGAYFFASESSSPRQTKKHRTSDLRQMTSGSGRPDASRSGAAQSLTSPRLAITKNKNRRRNADRTLFRNLRARARHAPFGALACRRSTAALVQGTHASQGLSFGPGFAERSANKRRLTPPAPFRLQRAPRTPVIVPAGMMSETARERR